ncbi:uncharacterized protein F5147DRAFT_676957 [Suillus discolor]|uniref:RNA-binding protein n=1 Tax=Suillus discolor TaxID=1912936 RepID=A0A9P7JYK8_9AGAM|nr:uncharacterized protein F5147DRAFT_676957 [Suillus discolor]KAG2115341.1 hypothetical protein F5147DRAFT_676957 [Suillus discolor]
MAYNRDWDKGKDNWGDSGAWATDRGGRGRDDDYGDGKRRKFNNGGYDTSNVYQEYSYEASYNQQSQSRPQDFAHDQSHDDKHQKGFQGKKRLVPSEPSPHVIFLGLDPDFSEADLQAYLSNNGCNIETVTIIRDRSTGISKGFGFAQFASVEHARAFVDPIFPFIQVPPPASHGASATATFYKALETGIPHNGRRVKIDYSQSALPDKARGRQNMNDGTRDIGNTQGPVLLFRGLDPLSGPQAIAQAMMNSAGPGKNGAKGMKRIILIKDRVTLASFGFAFVEFVDNQSAASVLATSMSPQIHPSGFRISDKPVAASFAHQYSFQPVDHMLRDETAIPSSVNLGGVEGAFVKYWDESAMVAVLEFKVEEPAQPQVQPSTGPVKEKKEKKKKDDALHKPLAPSVLPISDKPVTLNFNRGALGNKLNVSTAKAPGQLSLGFSADDFADDEDDAEPATSTEDNKVTASKMVAPLITSKKTVSNIQKWNQVQEELKDGPNAHAPANPPAVVMSTVVSTAPSRAPSPEPVETEFEFSDTTAMTCLLCARQFKSLDQLKRHNKESSLHKKNFKDANLRDVAREKAVTARQTADKAPEQPKYRDRASERRIMHNQPDVPLPDNIVSTIGKKRRQVEGPPPPPSPPPVVNPGQDEANVGNKLLKIMGWKEGSGLGTDGEGRVDPIQTNIYAQGVGLGASKGRELGKYTDGYAGYVHMAQDAARERFGS